jgi:lysozyme
MSKARILVASLTLSASAFVGLAVHEGYRDTAYIPVKGDVPTIGFGDTHGVKPGDKTDPIRALIRLSQHAESFQADLRKCIGDVPMHQHEWDSIVSWAYNVGTGAACKSTLVRKLQAGDYAGACRELLRWDRFKGQPLPGLTIRRQSEFRQCMGAK